MDPKCYIQLDCLHLMHFLAFLHHDKCFICLKKQEFQTVINPGVVVGWDTVRFGSTEQDFFFFITCELGPRFLC